MPIIWTPNPNFNRLARGAKPSPKHKLLAAEPFRIKAAPPVEFGTVPKQLNYWGNDRYGICVTAEEAFAKGCPTANFAGIFITEAECIRWARAHGVLNGASLTGVLDDMREKGFVDGPQTYSNGDWAGVDYTNQTVLRAAIAERGTVKIGIAADALPSGAGSVQGWYDLTSRNYGGSDHCVSLSGYGSAAFIFKKLEVTLPSGLPADTQGYLLFTWSTMGFVTHPWLLGATDESEVRNPTTVGVPPLPSPTPPPTPIPPTPIPPGPTPAYVEVEYLNGPMKGRWLQFPNTPV